MGVNQLTAKRFWTLLICCLISSLPVLSAQVDREFILNAPINEEYFEELDELGWEQYYHQEWTEMQEVFSISEKRSTIVFTSDSLSRRMNLLSRIRVGQAKAKLGLYEEGVREMTIALQEGETYFGPILDWSFYHVALALIYEEVGNLNKAFFWHEEASRIINTAVVTGSPNYFLKGNKDSNLGSVYEKLGLLGEAKIWHERSIEKYLDAGKDGMIRITGGYTNYAITLGKLGLFEQAHRALNKADALTDEFRIPWSVYAAKGQVNAMERNNDRAILNYRKAVSYGINFVEPDHPFPLFRPRTFLEIRGDFARFLLTQNKEQEAIRVLREGQAIAEKFGQVEDEYFRDIELLIAETYLKSGQTQKALAITEKLVGTTAGIKNYTCLKKVTLTPNNSSVYLLKALRIQAEGLYELWVRKEKEISTDLILANCYSAQRIIESILRSHGVEYQYSKLLDDNRAIYDLPVRIAYEQQLKRAGDSTLAQLFLEIERGKSMDLSLTTKKQQAAANAKPELKGLINDRLLIMAQLRNFEQQLSQCLLEGKTDKEKNLLIALRNANRKLDGLNERIADEHPKYDALTKQGKSPVELSAFQALLKKEEIALLYHVDETGLIILAVSKTSVEVDRVSGAELFQQIDAFSNEMGNADELALRPDTAWLQAAFAVFKALIGNQLADDNYQSLLLIPDGQLSFLPWSALLTRQESIKLTWRSLPYLIRSYEIGISSSATTLALQREIETDGKNELFLGIAPTYESNEQYAENNPRGALLETVSPLYFRQLNSPLSFNTKEVERAGGNFLKRKIFTGLRASEAAFKQWAPTARYLHLAAHAYVTDYPSFSHVALLPDAAGEDGLLYADEVYNLQLNADLVVLSACSTGDGRYHQGSGVQSLARAFRASGGRQVMMSRWPIADKISSGLISGFFQTFAANQDPKKSLRIATENYLETQVQAPLTHPHFWAGFYLLGDNAIPRENMEMSWWWALLLASLLSGLIYLYFRRRKTATAR